MKSNYKKISGVVAIFVLAIMLNANVASANPSYVGPTVQTNSSTSSPAYMTPGTATSTLTFDSYNPTSNVFVARDLALLMQFTGSSTLSTLNINLEYSQDGIDWYKDMIVNDGRSTTTAVTSLNMTSSMSWAFASSTVNGAPGYSNIATRAVYVPLYTRFVRAVFSIVGANGGIWGQFVPVKERL